MGQEKKIIFRIPNLLLFSCCNQLVTVTTSGYTLHPWSAPSHRSATVVPRVPASWSDRDRWQATIDGLWIWLWGMGPWVTLEVLWSQMTSYFMYDILISSDISWHLISCILISSDIWWWYDLIKLGWIFYLVFPWSHLLRHHTAA